MDQFEYTTLPSEDHIRIIELLPATEDIECNLITELRHHAQDPYDAISYVWGEGKDVEIICCKKSMRVTANLAGALRAIRTKNTGGSVRLWADAMSINQRDTKEKNHQVKRMGLVYENATRVHIWLGPDECGIAQNLFDLIRQWIKFLHGYGEPSKVPHTIVTNNLCRDSNRGLNLATLMELPWFSRVWVVQEVALSQNAQLHWGNATMDFADLVELACFCDGSSNVISLIGGDNAALKFLRVLFRCVYRIYGKTESWGPNRQYYFKRLSQQHPPHSGLFLDILLIGKSLRASEPKDHIYAFLGNPLALGGDGKSIIEPDYGKLEEEVNLELTNALFRSPESPYVLCFVQHCSDEEVTGSRGPSWVPRWRLDTPAQRPMFTIGNIGLGYKAGGRVENVPYRIQDNRILVLQGRVFDELYWTSELLKSENLSLDPERWDEGLRAVRRPYVELLWEQVSAAFERFLGSVQELDRARYEDDFSYTLVTAYNNPRIISRKEHKHIFKAYRRVLENRCRSRFIDSRHVVSKRQDKEAGRFETHSRNCSERRFGVTKSGRFALVPKCAQAGDICALLLGMATPFVLRPAEVQLHGEGRYHLVGEAYVHFAMRGELASDLEKANTKLMLI